MFHEPLAVPVSKVMSGFLASGAWICHTGKLRKVNEDASLFGSTFSGASASAPTTVTLSERQWIIAAADGIGGHKAGAYASREVVTNLATKWHPELLVWLPNLLFLVIGAVRFQRLAKR